MALGQSSIGIMVTHHLCKDSGGEFNLESDLDHLEVHFGGSTSFYCGEDTLIGKLPANQGMMNGQIPAVGSFPVAQTTPGYVKVVAVDRSGNRSGASPATAATPRLLKDEYIDSLTVSKLTAGTLTANTILGASIRTAKTGARVEMSQQGIRAFNQFNEETVTIDAATGDGTFTGQLQTGTGIHGISIIPGDEPVMLMVPEVDNPSHYGELLTIDDLSTQSDWSGAMTRLANRKFGTEDQDGGVLQLWERGTILSHKRIGGEEQYIGLGWPVDEHILFHGKWTNNLGALPTDAFFIALIDCGTPFNSWTHAYGSTMASAMMPIYSLFRPAGIVSHTLTGSTGTNFTVSWGSSGQQVYIMAWCVRVGPSF